MSKRKNSRRDILVPTDGAAPSRRAAREAGSLARKLGAGIVGLHVITPFEILPRKGLPDEVTPADFEKHARKVAARFLVAVRKAAAANKVACRCHVIRNLSAWKGIIEAAKTHRCGYIFMGTHGRRGLRRMLLGSVTQQVLARSPVPVLVCR